MTHINFGMIFKEPAKPMKRHKQKPLRVIDRARQVDCAFCRRAKLQESAFVCSKGLPMDAATCPQFTDSRQPSKGGGWDDGRSR